MTGSILGKLYALSNYFVKFQLVKNLKNRRTSKNYKKLVKIAKKWILGLKTKNFS